MATHDLKTDPRVGTRLAGRYLIEARIDAGGMATVYKAADTTLGRPVAVKIMHPSLAADPSFASAFRAEAQSAARLSHPNVVTVYDYGESDGALYIVMEVVDGTTLRALLERFGRLDAPNALHVARSVAAALDHAHAKGIVHRDIKPENVLLTPDGQVKVVDFGIAKALNRRPQEHTYERPIGTVAYVAPEQIRGNGVDGRVDVYALGAVTYEMTTGRPPFRGSTPQEVASYRLSEPTLRPSISPEIDSAIARATAARPEDRFSTPGDFAAALGQADGPTFASALTATATLPPPAGATKPVERAVAPPAPPPSPPVARTPDGVDVLPFQLRLRRRRKRILRVLLVLLLLLAIGAAAAYTAMPKPITVPDLTGQTVEQARTALDRLGLSVGAVDEIFHDVAPQGTIVGTDPDPGTEVQEQTTITLLVSKGPELFEVPDIIGKPLEEAQALMTAAGFTLSVENEEHHDSIPAGAIISHDPARNEARRGTSFIAVMSLGPPLVAVPNVEGRTPAEARSALEAAGFAYGPGEDFSDTVEEGTVIRTEPGAGRQAPKGTRVVVVASKGPRPFPMPDLVGISLEAAKEKARSSGLIVRNEYAVPGSGKPSGEVQGQNPPAGTSVRRGTPIDLYYAT